MTKKNAKPAPFQARQGDVMIVAVDALPDVLTPAKTDPRGVVLAEGEATGHHHRIGPKFRTASLFQGDEGTYLRVTGGAPVALTHEEHEAVTIPPGNYRVIRQREYSPDEIRFVAD